MLRLPLNRTIFVHPTGTWLRLNPALLLLLAGIVLVMGINRFAPQALPQDPQQRLSFFEAANQPREAEVVYEDLLAAAPLDPDLHYAYIQNHFKIPEVVKAGSAGPQLRQYYTRLAAARETADIGNLGLGLILLQEKKPTQALGEFRQVANRELKFLNISTGSSYLELGEVDLAEAYFRREIAVGGDLAGAVSRLSTLYIDRQQLDGLSALSSDPQTAAYLNLGARRYLAIATGNVIHYLGLTFASPLKNITFEAGLVALLICTLWTLYLWRIYVSSHPSFLLMVVVLLLGVFSALVSLTIHDGLGLFLPKALGGHWYSDFLLAFIHIGLIEELVKFLPVALIVILARRAKEPIDLVIFGSLSALGFASLENSLYFSVLGLGNVLPRFVFSTVLHLAMTNILIYVWSRGRSEGARRSFTRLLCGYLLASVVHTLFDYWLGSPGRFQLLSYIVLFIAVREYYRTIQNTLNFSSVPGPKSVSDRRLNNYNLLFSGLFVLLMIVYLHDNVNFSTEIANRQLFQAGLISLPAAFGIFGALGKFGLREGHFKPMFPRPVLYRKLEGA